MKKVDVLRKKYPRFVYEGYSYRISDKKRAGKITANLEVFFDFKILTNKDENIHFKPKIIIKNIDRKRVKRIGDRVLDNFIFHLGLMEIPSYWKTACSPEIEIKAGNLDKNQIKWWKDFIMRGMGQFFYENKIDFRKPNFLKIISNNFKKSKNKTEHSKPAAVALECSDRFLVPMGEGKDSIVTLELLKKILPKKQLACLIVNPTKAHFKILKIAGINNPVIVERKVDLVLLKLNQQGYLNGHTPITAVISNLAVFAAVLFGYGNVVMSCEKSANEGNIKYLGKIINHQWSKSFEFEQKFRKYIVKYLAKNLNYFSFLRPLYEIQIAKIFSNFPQYFPVFLSCNEARKTYSGRKKPTGKQCGKCPKCLFVFTILYPFTEEKKLIKIFGKPARIGYAEGVAGGNLFEKKELLPIMKGLIGESKCKPLECIGTKKESSAAFCLSWQFATDNTYGKLPFLLEYFEKKILPKYPDIKQTSKKILKSWNNQNNLPKKFDKILLRAYHKL